MEGYTTQWIRHSLHTQQTTSYHTSIKPFKMIHTGKKKKNHKFNIGGKKTQFILCFLTRLCLLFSPPYYRGKLRWVNRYLFVPLQFLFFFCSQFKMSIFWYECKSQLQDNKKTLSFFLSSKHKLFFDSL